MKSRKMMLALMMAAATAAQAQMPDLPVDKSVRIGRLDNGLTYYLRHNNWPENRADFYIAQRVGSLQEEESQRGLAHFLEHMCFNGSDNFKGNGIIEYCRSIGVEFGADLNAYTSIDETVYNINNVPTTRQESLDSCLLILRDWADGLLLEPSEIDKERGVIHEEWRLRTSASSRMFERNLPKLYPGSKYGVRYPIGLMEVIDNFKYQELRDYYEKWYHPQNQAIVVVGNIDMDHTEAKIKELFSPITNPKDIAAIERVEVPDNAKPIVIIDKDKEQTVNFVELCIKHDAFPDSLKGNMAYAITDYVVDAAMSMLDDRMTEAAQKPDCPFVRASVSDGQYIFAKTKDALQLSVIPKEMSQTGEALTAAIKELRRAAEHGFTATEFARFKEEVLSQVEKQYTNRDKQRSISFAKACTDNYLDNEPIMSIEDKYQLYQQIVPAIPLDAVNGIMKQLVQKTDSNTVIINFNTEAEGNVYPTEQQLLDALHAGLNAEVEAYVDNVKNEPLISQMPKPGKIKKEKYNKEMDYTELTLSNGITVALKQTDFKKDQVILTGFGGQGSTAYAPGDINAKVFDNVISMSGIGGFSSTELQKALAGKNANADLSLQDFCTHLSGHSTPKDIETMMQMAYLYFTDITKDEASFQSLLNQLRISLKNRDINPDAALSDSITATIYGHSKDKEPLRLADVDRISYDAILAMAKERTQNAAGWDFTIIGNYNDSTIRPLICQYLGSLPAKKAGKFSPRRNKMAKGEVSNIFARKQETPKSTALIVWHNPDMAWDYEKSVQIDMVGQILSMEYLQKIREEASAAYTVSANGYATLLRDGYHNFAIQAYCPMKPEKKEEAMRILNEEMQRTLTNIDAEKLTKIKELMLKQHEDAQKQNSHWASVITMQRLFGIDINTSARKVIESQTPEKLSAFMKEFLAPGNKATIMMLPEE